jgi:hypothetical protein
MATNENYLVDKRIGYGFTLPKEEVKKILDASIIDTSSIGNDISKPDEDYGDFPLGSDGVPPNVKFLERLRVPFEDTVEGGKTKDALSNTGLINHVDKIYEDLKTGVNISKKTGGRGASGGRGAELTLNGKSVSELTGEDVPEMEKALALLKKAGDNATGNVARRIMTDFKKLKAVETGLKTGKKPASVMADELRKQLQAGTEDAKDVAKVVLKSVLKKAKEVSPASLAKTQEELTALEAEFGAEELAKAKAIVEAKAQRQAKRVSLALLAKAEAEADADVEDEGEVGGEGGDEGEDDDRATVATDPRAERKTKGVKNFSEANVSGITKEWFAGRDVRTDIIPLAEMFGVEIPVLSPEPVERRKQRSALIKLILAKRVDLMKQGVEKVFPKKVLKVGGAGGDA